MRVGHHGPAPSAVRIFSDRPGPAALGEVAKDFDSGHRLEVVCCEPPDVGRNRKIPVMLEKTCAACDCKLETDVIQVIVGGKTVEVCCAECARALREASASVASENEARP
jgi:hypothetical protein